MPSIQNINERFWSKVNIVDDAVSCWEWQNFLQPHPRKKNKTTYGIFWIGSKRDGTGRMEAAHRVSWRLTNGEIPHGLKVLHHCDNTACVRPDHLFLGTQMDNYQDMKQKGRERRAHGSDHYMAKLTEQDVMQIRQLYQRGTGKNNPGNSQNLANKFGVSQATIYDVMRKGWKHIQ